MSNPICAPREPADGRLAESAVCSVPVKHFRGVFCDSREELDRLEEAAKAQASLESLGRKLAERVGLHPYYSISTAGPLKYGMVFGEGAKKRPLFIAPDNCLEFRKRSQLAYRCVALINGLYTPSTLEVDADGEITSFYPSNVACPVTHDLESRLENYFAVAGGTQHSIGRLLSAIPAHSLANWEPITDELAGRALIGTGHGPEWRALLGMEGPTYRSPWPLVRAGPGLGVTVNRKASLGVPYCVPGSESDAYEKAMEVANWMEKDNMWRANAGNAYKIAMISQPSFVAFMGKTKTDIYSREKINNQKLRFYIVAPGHLKLFMQRVTQPYDYSKATLEKVYELTGNPFVEYNQIRQAVCKLHSAQKMGLTGKGLTLMMSALNIQLQERGFAYLTVGDDTLGAALLYHDGAYTLSIFATDQSNFDLTQTAVVCKKVDTEIYKDMEGISFSHASLWREVRNKRIVIVRGAGTVVAEGLGTSGIPLQSTVNDMNQQCGLIRTEDALRAEGTVTFDGLTFFLATPGKLRDIMLGVFRRMGFSCRMEYQYNAELHSSDAHIRGYSVLRGMTPFWERHGLTPEHRHAQLLSVAWTLHALPPLQFLGYDLFVPGVHGTVARCGEQCCLNMSIPAIGFYPTATPVITWLAASNIARFGTSLVYPSKMWVKDADEFRLYNCMRIVGTLVNSGYLFEAVLQPCEPKMESSYLTDNTSVRLLPGSLRAIISLVIAELLTLLPKKGETWDRNSKAFIENASDKSVSDDILALGALDDGEINSELLTCTTAAKLLNFIIYRFHTIRQELWNPWLRWTLGSSVNGKTVAPELVLESVVGASSWADEMADEERLGMEVFGQIFTEVSSNPYANLRYLALREATLKNWGRPPPSVPLRHAGGGGGPVGSGEETKRKKTRRGGKKHKRETQQERIERETREHLDAEHEKEEEAENVFLQVRQMANRAARDYERESLAYAEDRADRLAALYNMFD